MDAIKLYVGSCRCHDLKVFGHIALRGLKVDIIKYLDLFLGEVVTVLLKFPLAQLLSAR